MIKDTNPDHYKVDDANFIKYIDDPKISGFGNWMFANGFNSGVWASTNWISVKDRLPENAGRYLVSAIENSRFTHVTVAQYNRHFILSGYRAYWRITHWMPLPEPPKEDKDDA